jgi:secreted PhoX family phosphatase
MLNFGDNLTVAPNGHLIVCEDQYTEVVDNHLRGITPQGAVYSFARLHAQRSWPARAFTGWADDVRKHLQSRQNAGDHRPWHAVTA